MNNEASLTDSAPPELYQRLADFRFKIRQFLRFSEDAARRHGLEPQQHQLLLVIKGLPAGMRPTVRNLSNRLCLRHNSTVELINRLEGKGTLMRKPGLQDRREVLIALTPLGEELLNKLSLLHWQELRTNGPALSGALSALIADAADASTAEPPSQALRTPIAEQSL